MANANTDPKSRRTVVPIENGAVEERPSGLRSSELGNRSDLS